jgi:predicted alpha/beta-fold hydrolase
MTGYKSGSGLWREISCDRFLHNINIPVMFLVSKDDPITRFGVVPQEDLKRNPNFVVGISDAGGHCEFFYRDYENNRYSRYT